MKMRREATKCQEGVTLTFTHETLDIVIGLGCKGGLDYTLKNYQKNINEITEKVMRLACLHLKEKKLQR